MDGDEINQNGTSGGAAVYEAPQLPAVVEGTGQPGDAAKALEPTPEPSAMNQLIDQWFADHFHGSPLGAVTNLYNLVHSAKEDLKKRLAST